MMPWLLIHQYKSFLAYTTIPVLYFVDIFLLTEVPLLSFLLGNYLLIFFLNRAHFFVLLFKNVIKLLYFVYFYLTELPCLVKFCTLFEQFGGMLYLMFWLLQHRLNF